MVERRVDPEGNEARYLQQMVDLHAARVLEVGSGSGRLSAAYAPVADRVLGIDIKIEEPSPDLRAQHAKFVFAVADARHIPCRRESFDVVLFARSL